MNANSNNSSGIPARGRRNRRRGRAGGSSEMQILTGGSRDVKPQFISFQAIQSAADTTTTITQALPILRNFSSGNGSRAQIIEVLKVIFTLPIAQEVDSNLMILLSTRNGGSTAKNPWDPDVFAVVRRQVALTTSGQYYSDLTATVDVTDGMGNGVLVGTDNVYCQIIAAGTGVTNATSVKILYRMYSAPVTEYMGIVQSQQ